MSVNPKVTKVCSKCSVQKSQLDFRENLKCSDGLHSWCQQCCKEYNTAYRKNPFMVKKPPKTMDVDLTIDSKQQQKIFSTIEHLAKELGIIEKFCVSCKEPTQNYFITCFECAPIKYFDPPKHPFPNKVLELREPKFLKRNPHLTIENIIAAVRQAIIKNNNTPYSITAKDVSDELNCSVNSLGRAFTIYNTNITEIKKILIDEKLKPKIEFFIKEFDVKRKTLEQIARENGVSLNILGKFFRKYHIRKTKIPKEYAGYVTYKPKLVKYEKVQQALDDPRLIEVVCTYCGGWFKPSRQEVATRIYAINGQYTLQTENRFYCSTACKKSCPTYNVKGDKPKDISKAREVQPELRQLVFERDNWTCIKCGKHKSEIPVPLHCHHIEGVEQNPIESADMDICVTLCEYCHLFVHTLPDCRYIDLRCDKNE